MRPLVVAFVVVLTASPTQSPDALLSDTRLTVHTLVREDVFAGFLENKVDRLAQAESNIDKLLQSRPGERANLLAWRSGAALYRAVVAHEAGNSADFRRYLAVATEGFAEAVTLPTSDGGVHAIRGGSYALFAGRLPADRRAEAWNRAWESYSLLWKGQGAGVADLPVHLKGELLAGLAQSAQRTGRTAEMQQFVNRMLEHLGNTPYEPLAKKWKDDPSAAATIRRCRGRLAECLCD